MSKGQNSKKETLKKPALTLKEKRAVKKPTKATKKACSHLRNNTTILSSGFTTIHYY